MEMQKYAEEGRNTHTFLPLLVQAGILSVTPLCGVPFRNSLPQMKFLCLQGMGILEFIVWLCPANFSYNRKIISIEVLTCQGNAQYTHENYITLPTLGPKQYGCYDEFRINQNCADTHYNRLGHFVGRNRYSFSLSFQRQDKITLHLQKLA